MKRIVIFTIALLFASIAYPAFSVEYGDIKVIPPTSSCEIIIDGIVVGAGMGTVVTNVTEGTHNVVVNLKDGTPIYRRTVEVIAHKLTTIPV
jgi:hypothetical protein